MTRLGWTRSEGPLFSAVLWVRDGELIRLFVAPEPQGGWDWRVWNTLYGSDYRFGTAESAAAGIQASERAAAELAARRTPSPETNITAESGHVIDLNSHTTAAPPPPYSKRVWERILISFHMACDDSDVEVARTLLQLLETVGTQRAVADESQHRRLIERLVAAHTRFWYLNNEVEN